MIELRCRHLQGMFLLDIDLRLPAQGVTGLFGPSGCGKTTLLRCLAGLIRPAQARLVVDGEVWQDGRQFLPPHQRSVGLVFQQAALFPHLTVRGNLDYARRRAPQAPPLLAAAMELLEIGPLLERAVQALSGGERQRVALARALAAAPRLLLMDEPLAALDAPRKAELLPFLERLTRELALPMVYVTHALPELQQLAHHVVHLDAGRVRAQGPLAQLQAALVQQQLALEPDAGVVLDANVVARDTVWQLVEVALDDGQRLRVRDDGQSLGAALRLRLPARDLALALAPPQESSISNALRGELRALLDDRHPAHRLAQVRVGGSELWVRVTAQSVHRLALRPGQAVWVWVKSVALAG